MIALACFMEHKESVTTAELREAFGEDGVRMAARNYYNWTRRVSKGVYTLSDKCRTELENTEFVETVAYYRSRYPAE